jgi:hypothetical protein
MKCRMTSIALFLYINLCLSEKLDSIPCSFTSTFILTRHILQSKNAQHPMKNFQKYTKSHEELPKIHKIPWGNMHKIPRGSSNDAQNPTRNFENVHNPMRNSQICTKFHEVYFWKFFMGCCAFLEVPRGQEYTCPFHSFTFSLQNTCFCNMHTDWFNSSP